MKTPDRHYPAAATPQMQPPAEDKHLLDYVRVLYKRRWIAVPVFLIVLVFGAVNTLRQTPIYQGRAQLLIEKDSTSVATLDQLFQSQDAWFTDDYYQTQYRILQSRSLAKRAIDNMKLWSAPRLGNGPEPRGPISLMGFVWKGVDAVAGLARGGAATATPAAAEGSDSETSAQSSRIDEFLDGLTITPVRNSRMVEIRYASTDPVFAAAAANQVARAYIEQSTEFKFTTTKQAADWLGDRLADQRKAVEASEAALQAFKEKHGAVSVADNASSNIVVQRLTDLNAALTKAKTERINKEALYNQLKSIEGTSALDTFPAVLTNEFIQKQKVELADLQRQQAQLAERYGERHSEMIKVRTAIQIAEAKLRTEIAKVVDSVKNQYTASRAEEESLQAALNSQKAEALSLNRTGIQYGVLQREVESNRQIYQSLLQRTKETDISSERRSTNARIVDEAEVPRAPVLPRRERDLLIATFGGLLLAVGVAFFVDYLDNAIKTPAELRHYLGVPYLGMVPALPADTQALLTGEVPPGFAEAMKSVRTNVLFSSADEGVKSLVVTSAGPGEGKSVMASNLSIALAQTGLRVLLVDADMRRPRVHEIFTVPDSPGLSNLLVGDCRPSEALRQSSDVPTLWLLPAGVIPPNPAELLGSKRFQQFVNTLGDHFDWVVIDSPPVLAVADASVLGNLASGVVFVVGAEQTSRQAARTAVDQLRSVNAHLVGAILNRASLDKNPYYYSQYYRKEYVKHYAQSTERARKALHPVGVNASASAERRRTSTSQG